MIVTVKDISEIEKAAESILMAFPKERILAFYGEMGSGKTTIIKALCKKVGVTDSMSSPTYSIVNQYAGKETVYHIDLYRLKNIKEALDAGIEEYLHNGCYCFIEWPELIEPLLPEGTIRISVNVLDDGMRELDIKI